MASHHLSSQKFIEDITNLLETNDFSSAVSVFFDKNHEEYLKNSSWDLIPVFCKHVTKDTKLNNVELASCCERFLEELAEKAKPEEAVLEFLEQMDESDSEKFKIILKLLNIVLSREITNRIKSLEWILNSIRYYTEQFSCYQNKDDYHFQDEDFYNSDKVNEIVDVMSSIILFYEPFVGEVKNSNIDELKCLLSSRLIQMFDIFLPYVNVDLMPKLKVIKWKMFNLILQLVSNPMSLLEYVFYRALNVMKSKPKESLKIPKEIDIVNIADEHLSDIDSVTNITPYEDETVVSDLAYGMFFYSLLSESEYEQIRVPIVYNPKYIMLSLIYVAVPFFDKTDIATSNGLKFLNLLLNQLSDLLTKSDLYFSSHKYLLIHVNNVMVFSQVEENRKLAFTLFKKYIESFNWEGRYLLLFNFRPYVNHSGTLGFLISLLKEFVSTFLEIPQNSHVYRKFIKYYKGKLLFDIIKKYCYLSSGFNKDLIENADHVISSLNILRYLVLRDKKNLTGVRHFIIKINEEYLSPLKENITSSKRYYEQKLSDLEKSKSEGNLAASDSSIDVEFTVKGQTLPKLTKEQQKTGYLSCINAVDLIDLLLKRLLECLLAFYPIRRCSSKSQNDCGKNESNAKFEGQQYENKIREKILNASLQFVSKYGWSKSAITNGAESLGYPGVTNGIFPNGGADLINYFYIQCNQKLKDYMLEVTTRAEKPVEPKDFIQNSVEVRLRMLIPYLDKWPQAIAIMSLPPNVPVALANLLTLVDDICFFAGDKSVDFNWYTRRVGVGGIYKMSELYMIQDKSLDYHETWKFLDRRLTEAFQIQQILSNSSEDTTVAKDVAIAAFTTARNILRLNVLR